MRELRLRSAAAATTRATGRALGLVARGGDVVALSGELGAGKTTLVQGLAVALGVTERVTSPTFLIQRCYAGGRVPLVHLDVYRLDSLAELTDLGLEEVFGSDRVTVVEWGDAVVALLPDDRLDVELHFAADEAADEQEPRELTLRAAGPGWGDRLETVARQLARAESAA